MQTNASALQPASNGRLQNLLIDNAIEIGSGAQGAVYSGTWSGKIVAVKISSKELCMEVKHLQALKHKNLVRMIDVGRWKSSFAIIMEHCSKGSLGSILRTTEHIQWDSWSKWVSEIVTGMQYLHTMNIVHRDLKPDNILITSENEVRIADFGVSRELTRTKDITFMGTCRYMAPELLKNDPCSKKVDVWSFGVVLWQMLCRNQPYAGLSDAQIIFNVPTNKTRLKIPSSAPNIIWRLMKMCLMLRYEDRPLFHLITSKIEDSFRDTFQFDMQWMKITKACQLETADITYDIEPAPASKDPEDVVSYLRERGVNDNLSAFTIHRACHDSHVPVVRWILDEGININSRRDDGSTPLHVAAEMGALDVVQLLLERGANAALTNEDNELAIHLSCKGNHAPVGQVLLDDGIEINATVPTTLMTPLLFAARWGATDVARLLLSRGADHTIKDSKKAMAIHLACRFNHLSTVQVLLEHGVDINSIGKDGRTPLHEAAEAGALDIVRFLVEQGANATATEQENMCPIHLACRSGAVEVVRYLLEHGADVNIKGRDTPFTPLHYAAWKRSADVVRLLLEKGADLTAKTKDNRSVIHTACDGPNSSIDDVAVVQLLLDHGEDVNIKGYCGWTPLHMAAEQGAVNVVRLLLERGADVEIKDEFDMSAMHKASWSNHVEVVRLLLEHGANVNTRGIGEKTPLLNAAKDGFVDIVRLLLENGADWWIRDNHNQSAIHLACCGIDAMNMKICLERGWKSAKREDSKNPPIYLDSTQNRVKVVELLLEHGVDVNMRGEDDWTPLHCAAADGNADLVRLLLEMGADRTLTTKDGRTALDNVMFWNNGDYHPEIVKLLS